MLADGMGWEIPASTSMLYKRVVWGFVFYPFICFRFKINTEHVLSLLLRYIQTCATSVPTEGEKVSVQDNERRCSTEAKKSKTMMQPCIAKLEMCPGKRKNTGWRKEGRDIVRETWPPLRAQFALSPSCAKKKESRINVSRGLWLRQRSLTERKWS